MKRIKVFGSHEAEYCCYLYYTIFSFLVSMDEGLEMLFYSANLIHVSYGTIGI